jgi:hypothetical protein
MHIARAFSAGVVGALAVSVIMALGRGLGIVVGFEALLGSWLLTRLDTSALLLGLGAHAVVGGLFGVAYAAGFQVLGRASASLGLRLAVAHTVLSGLVLGAIPAVHPMVSENLPAPDVFMSGYGAPAAMTFIAAHLVFGACVGALTRVAFEPRRIARAEAARA